MNLRKQTKKLSDYKKYNHDEGARLAINSIIKKIKSDPTWRSSLFDEDVTKALCKRTKPAPDGRIFSGATQCHVAIEYKPAYADLDEIGKGFNQCFDYITDLDQKGKQLNQGSIFIIPKVNQDKDRVEEIYARKFKQTIYNKNPISLVTYNPFDPSEISLILNFGDNLSFIEEPKSSYGNNMIKYWASWRENYPSYNYYLLKTASEFTGTYNSEATSKIWHDFYFKYYCYPENCWQTLDVEPNRLFVWEDKQIWQESTKRDLKKALEQGSITEEEAINRLRWAAASSSSERTRIGKLIKNIAVKRPAQIHADNNYADLKKNSTNFFNHTGLWDPVTWEVSDLGHKFLERIEEGADPFDEMVALALIPGKWMELIQDVKRAQSIINHATDKEFKLELQKIFKKNGTIGFNPGRKTTGSRKFLQSEQQILGRAGILEKNGRSYYQKGVGWKIDSTLLDLYNSYFYENYPEIPWAA